MPVEQLSRLKRVRMRLRFRIAFALLAAFHAADYFWRDYLAKRRGRP